MDADSCVLNICSIYIPYKIKQIFLEIKIDMFYIAKKIEKMKNNNLWPGDAVISLSFSDNSLKKGTYIYLHSR